MGQKTMWDEPQKTVPAQPSGWEIKPVVLDATKGELLKEQGNSLAVGGREFNHRLEAARLVAKTKETFTTDDVWIALGSVPSGHDAPSGMGSVMRYLSQSKEIVWTGLYKKSERPEQHRKPIKVWKRC